MGIENTVDYHERPELLYDTKVNKWWPYEDNPVLARQIIKDHYGCEIWGEFHYARVNRYDRRSRKFEIEYEIDKKREQVTLDELLKIRVEE